MTWLVRGLLVVVLAGVTACSSEDDGGGGSASSGLEGMYVTTSLDENSPCNGAPMSLVLEPPYFQIVDDPIGSTAFIDVYPCTGPDPATCDDYAFVFFAEEVGDGRFHTEQTSRSGEPSGCYFDWAGTDVSRTPSGVTITETRRGGEASGDVCEGDITDAQVEMAKMLPCNVVVTWSGDRL